MLMSSRHQRHLLYRTANGIEIFVEPGKKSAQDFIVRYKEPAKRLRTPKHIHIIVDLFAKHTGDPTLTTRFIRHILNDIIQAVTPLDAFPPTLQIFSPQTAESFSPLDAYGEYTVEFLLVVIELLMLQEKTNYPQGNLNRRLFQQLLEGADIFSIVSTATFRR